MNYELQRDHGRPLAECTVRFNTLDQADQDNQAALLRMESKMDRMNGWLLGVLATALLTLLGVLLTAALSIPK
jgi:hypothetical protein